MISGLHGGAATVLALPPRAAPRVRGLVEDALSLDVLCWRRSGHLGPSWWSFSCEWHRAGAQVGSIGVKTSLDAVHLSYRAIVPGGEQHDVEERLDLAWVPCYLGGERPYLRCPGPGCGRRVLRLFLCPTGRFLCRLCSRLSYESQHRSAMERAIARARKIRRLRLRAVRLRGGWGNARVQQSSRATCSKGTIG